MKKILTFFVMLLVGMSLYAQDVIVKKDGTTIMAKVLTVGTEAVEYKNWNNQDGPTYVLFKTELLAINYANGTKEDFSTVIATPQETTPTFTQPTYTQSDLNRAVSQAAYNSTAGRGKIIGGSLLLALVGIPGYASAITCLVVDAPLGLYIAEFAVGTVGTIAGCALIRSGRDDKKSAMYTSQIPILQHDFKIGDYTLTPSVDMFNDRLTKKKGIGAGLAFRF